MKATEGLDAEERIVFLEREHEVYRAFAWVFYHALACVDNQKSVDRLREQRPELLESEAQMLEEDNLMLDTFMTNLREGLRKLGEDGAYYDVDDIRVLRKCAENHYDYTRKRNELAILSAREETD